MEVARNMSERISRSESAKKRESQTVIECACLVLVFGRRSRRVRNNSMDSPCTYTDMCICEKAGLRDDLRPNKILSG